MDERRQQLRKSERRRCVAWLHARADSMNDPQARALLNSAALHLGGDEALAATPAPAVVESALSVQNPIEELRLAALDAFPTLNCQVYFASFPEQGPYGATTFPDDGSAPQVQVAVGIPMEAVIEVMAHELAHVAAGIEADHGPVWEAAFERIHAAYLARSAFIGQEAKRDG